MEAILPQNLKGYELRERIGAGGFGAVYKAYQSTVGREVAVKIILPGLANQPEFIRRFEGEAQIVARLEHPHIVPLYDYWRDPDGAYLVMRWLKGGSLRDTLQQGPFDLRSAALLLDQVAGALSLAHRNHVIHRDIKPGNILLDEDGNAYLTDFGIAKDLNLSSNNTQPDAIIGSLDYISPEQARSEPITPRTDIYSLGVTLYEIITGEHPFQNLSSIERLYKHINDPLPEITTLDDTMMIRVNRVIQKATAKNPDHRYPDALAFAADFREAIGLNRVPTSAVELLTQREQEVLQLIIDGHANKEIAQRLTVTLSTVKWYVNQIYTKLGVRSRVQAMVRARELNLLTKSAETLSVTNIPTEDFHPENPYKGLRAFQSADNRDFFGREKVTAKLVKRLEEAHEFGRFLAVIGPSGSGKSSLVKAGLIPALWRGELPASEKWFVVEMLPGAHPLDELEIALTRVAANQSGSLNEQLSRDRRGLIRAAQLILPNDGSELVLVIDQFEEVFTLLEDETDRTHFLDLLYTAVTEVRSRVRIIITLRADFYDRPLHYADFGELVRSRMETVLPLSAEELERAISKPAERVGVSFESGLVASIVAEVNYQAGALPLLQYALTELFEQRKGRLLTREAYEAIGGSVGALARRADEVFRDFDDASQEAARQMFLRLVTLGEGVEDTRRRVNRSELRAIAPDPDVMDEVIDTYAEYRLLSLDNDPGTRTPTVEVAHEAILRVWERLRNWLNESRDEIKLQRQLGGMATEWHVSKQDISFLARGARLEQFEKWIADTKLALTGAERAYLDASIAHRAREQQAEVERQAQVKSLEQRSVRFLSALVAVMFIALIGAVGLIGVAVNQSQMAQRSAAEAQNVALINGSQAALANSDTDQAIALALQAVTLDPDSARSQAALSEAAYAPGTIRVFEGHTDYVNGTDISPDGLTALSASWDSTVILWNLQTGAMIRKFEGHTGRTSSVAFLPDGRSAISGSSDALLIQWDLQTGAILRQFTGQPDEIWSLSISPDGKYVAAAGSGTKVWVWDITTGEIVRTLEGHTASIESVAFSNDGSQLLSASHDTTLMLWNVATGALVRRFEGHFAMVTSAAFNADDTRIASSSLDGTLILWDVTTGELLDRFTERRDLWDIVFTLDGRSLISGGIGGSLQLWDIETVLPANAPWGHSGTITNLSLHPDGRRILTASADHTLRLWDLESGQMIYRSKIWGTFIVNSNRTRILMRVSGDNYTDLILIDVATGQEISNHRIDEAIDLMILNSDSTLALLGMDTEAEADNLILWDVNQGQEIRRFTGHPPGLSAIDLSPDSQMAVSGGFGGVLILWDVNTGQEIRRFPGYEGNDFRSIWISLAFSLDGQTVIGTNFSGNIVRWDVATGTVIREFVGHDNWAWNFVFSGDGQHGYSGSEDKTAIVWEIATGKILNRFNNSHPVAGVGISQDGRFGMEGINAQLRDLSTGEIIRRYDTLALVSWFVPGNQTILVAPPDGPFEVWRLDITRDQLLIWTRANRYIPELTCDQRELYSIEPLCVPESLQFTTGSG